MGTKKTMKGVYSVERKGVFYWYARIDGRRIYCGKGEEGRKIAEASKAKEIAGNYEMREVQAGLKRQRIEFKTVTELFKWYLELPEVQAQKRYSTLLALVSHLNEHFGNKPILSVDTDGQRQYRKKRSEEGAASSSVDEEFKVLRAALRMAYVEGKITSEMMPRKFIFEGDITPRRIITDAEYGAIIANAKGDFADLLVCAWETGMRVSEITNLTAGQVRLGVQHISGDTLNYIHLGVFDTKTGAERIVPVSPELKTVLDRRLVGLGPEDVVFTIDGKKTSKSGVAKRFRAICGKVGVTYGDKPKDAKGGRSGVVFHCFRHTRVSRWVKAGFSDEIIRRASGHQSLAAFQNYVKLDAHTIMRLVQGENVIRTSQKPRRTAIIKG